MPDLSHISFICSKRAQLFHFDTILVQHVWGRLFAIHNIYPKKCVFQWCRKMVLKLHNIVR